VITRLGRSDDVRRTLSAGGHRAGRLLAVHALVRPEDPAGATRLTVVASRRVGNAVQRNRAKRLLRAAAQQLVWSPGHDVVLVARHALVDSDVHATTDELRRLGRGLKAVAPAAPVSPLQHTDPSVAIGAGSAGR
jgi:ribonuclease P protein component